MKTWARSAPWRRLFVLAILLASNRPHSLFTCAFSGRTFFGRSSTNKRPTTTTTTRGRSFSLADKRSWTTLLHGSSFNDASSASKSQDRLEKQQSEINAQEQEQQLALDPRLTRSCVQVVDPNTGCEVVLVGCFHGANSSAEDVLQCLQASRTDVIVLELCPGRFSDLRIELEQKDTEAADKTPWLARFADWVMWTSQAQGPSAGAAAALLGGVSGFQTALSGLEDVRGALCICVLELEPV